MVPSYSLKLIGPLCCLSLLLCCTKDIKNPATELTGAPAAYSMSAEAYLALAKNQSGEEKQNLLMLAAGRMVHEGQWEEAAHILTPMDNLSEIQNDEKNLLLAKIELVNNQPREAITQLSAIKQQSALSPFYQALYHEILAASYEAAGQAAYSVSERIKLDRLLPNDTERADNNRALWRTLAKLPSEELQTLAIEAKPGSALQGWMKLAVISRQNDHPEALVERLEKWQQQYPVHAANFLLPSPLSSIETPSGAARKIALLLPLTGPLAGPGNAVRDGVMAAAHTSHDKTIQIYDTASGDVTALYQQAVAEGAEFIIGPLLKNDVAKVAAIEHPVPTLLLNDAQNNDSNLYQFGLSPVNEAKQVAIKAHHQGLRHALVIAPAGAWGNDIVSAFSSEWHQEGGEVVEVLPFDEKTDLTVEVRKLLHVTEKEAEEKQFKIPNNPEGIVSPQRRQDFDMIFLLAYPSKARQIMPLLKYYFAGNIPVYATSSVYAGTVDVMRDRDLDGLIFCDMPFMLTQTAAANKNWPEQYNSYHRLYALGLDSYALSAKMTSLKIFPALRINEQSGLVYLNQAQQVGRELAWGTFKKGVVQPV